MTFHFHNFTAPPETKISFKLSKMKIIAVFLIGFASCQFQAVQAESLSNDGPTASSFPTTSQCVLSTQNEVVGQIEDMKTFRVPPSGSSPMPVDVQIHPLRLINVDDSKSRLEIDLTFYLLWNDTRLAFANTTTAYANALCELPHNVTLTNSAAIWTPQFSIVESTSPARLTLEQRRDFLTVTNEGEVTYTGKFIGELFCPMQRRLYPFDQQICNITILGQFIHYKRSSWITGSDSVEAIVSQYREKVFETNIFTGIVSTNEWSLNSNDILLARSITRPIAMHTFEARSLTFQVFLKRNSWPLVWTWIVPPVLLSTTVVAGMFLWCTPDGRFGFGASIVITISVLINSLNSKLSAGMDGLPLLAWLYIGLLAIILVATMVSRMPCAIAERVMKQKETNEKQTRWNTWVKKIEHAFGFEQAVNVVFAIGFFALQAALIGYVVAQWITGCGVQLSLLDDSQYRV